MGLISGTKYTLADFAWSLLVTVGTVVSLVCFGVLLDSFYEYNPGPYDYPYSIGWYSISEMLINIPSETKCYIQSGILLSVCGSLVLFLETTDRTVQTVQTIPHKIHYASFILSVPTCQLVVMVEYSDFLALHLAMAGLFFTFAAISGTSGAFLEFKHGDCYRVRKGVQYLGTALIWVCLSCLLLSVFTYTDIPIVDRRPPLVIGEFAGVLSFVLQTTAKMPLLTKGSGSGDKANKEVASEVMVWATV